MGIIREIYEALEIPDPIINIRYDGDYYVSPEVTLPASWSQITHTAVLKDQVYNLVISNAKGYVDLNEGRYILRDFAKVEGDILREVSRTLKRAIEQAYPRKYKHSELYGWAANTHTFLVGREDLQDKFLHLWSEMKARLEDLHRLNRDEKEASLGIAMGLLTAMKRRYGG